MRMVESELSEKILRTNPGGNRGRGRPKWRWIDGWRKTRGNRVVEIGGQMPRVEDAGDICWRRARSTQGCRANDDDGGGGDNDDDDDICSLNLYFPLNL